MVAVFFFNILPYPSKCWQLYVLLLLYYWNYIGFWNIYKLNATVLTTVKNKHELNLFKVFGCNKQNLDILKKSYLKATRDKDNDPAEKVYWEVLSQGHQTPIIWVISFDLCDKC